MKVLYYGEPDLVRYGGVGNVAYYLPLALSKKTFLTYLSGIRSNKNFLGLYFNVFSRFVKKEFDVIHFNMAPPWINGVSMLLRFARSKQTPTVINIHGIPQIEWWNENKREPGSFVDWMHTLSCYNLADQIVVNTEHMRKTVVAWYRINLDKVAVIPNGVDLNMFTCSNDRMFLEGDPSILYVGHLSTLKGIDILIRAITNLSSELPNVKLHLVGGGDHTYFALLAKKEGIENRVVFHGFTEHSMLPKYFKSADICVFPSRQEGFGIVLLEAMASGIPVITSNIPAFKEIISDGRDGRLFKSEDTDALSKEIIALFQNQGLRKELSRNALEKAKKYSWENIADKYISLYKCLLG